MADEQQMISIPFEDWQKMSSRLDKLEKGGAIVKPKRVTERIATLRETDKGLVVGWKGATWTVKDPTTLKDVMMIKLLVQDKEGVVTEIDTDYLKFLNGAVSVAAKIDSQTAKEFTYLQGKINPIDPATDRIRNAEIDLEVHSVEYTAKVTVTEGAFAGTTIEIPTKFLNM